MHCLREAATESCGVLKTASTQKNKETVMVDEKHHYSRKRREINLQSYLARRDIRQHTEY